MANGAKLIDVGDEVMCRKGDEACVLCPTHIYRVADTRWDENSHMQIRVANSQNETHAQWFPVMPHFS